MRMSGHCENRMKRMYERILKFEIEIMVNSGYIWVTVNSSKLYQSKSSMSEYFQHVDPN